MPCTPKVLLVILNHNSLKSLGQDSIKFLRSILSTDYPALEVVIVDNASSDGSDIVIEQELKAVGKGKLIKLESNLGYAGGNNYGFRALGEDCKYVAFLNNDIEVEPDWLKKILEVMENDDSIAAAQPKILQLRDRSLIDSLGGMIDVIGRAYDLYHGLPDTLEIERPFDVFYARGAALVVRSDVFRNAGGFDEDYFIYYEETDLCWRLRLMGYRVVTVPTSRVYHLGGGTMGKVMPRAVYYRRRNQLTTLLKNYSLSRALFYSSVLIIRYLGFSVLRILFRKDLVVARAVLSALVWNFRNIRRILQKRMEVQANRRVQDSHVMKFMMSVRGYELAVKHLTDSY
jgi:GT2 family glycosyltransferase